ncbi:hypothetical protein BofuT4_uP037950.1 [Botrytis cinerea T4]|uniref:Uncharacterized protein n=1 Tax=Botryotinia fuckeliana (strain T4) TaxID=999810 RepID=G2Y575_BOTF4|nr:hypothetical protein BofuT4_uP037950.1 [Botrytis cinerea T4]
MGRKGLDRAEEGSTGRGATHAVRITFPFTTLFPLRF